MSTTVALLAHDRRQEELMQFVQRHTAILSRYQLVASEIIGQRLNQIAGLNLGQTLPNHFSSEVIAAAQVATGEIAAVIFLVDRLVPTVSSETQVLSHMCDLHNVPFASNLATAEAILTTLARRRVAHLIFNPVSGQGNPTQDLLLIQKLLSPQIDLEVHLTAIDIDPVDLAKAAIAANPDLIIASGGDGTVSAIAGALIHTGIPLGILPRGTANAFATALGIPTTIREACSILLAGVTRIVDVAQCNQVPMILLAGIGFEAEMVERANRDLKDRIGVLAYLLAGIQQVNQQELFTAHIQANDIGEESFQAAAITIANAAPVTSVLAQGTGGVIVDDGLLDITIVTPNSTPRGFTALIDLFRAGLAGAAPQREDIFYTRLPRIRVDANPPQKVAIDGEIIGTTPIEIECIPQALTVVAPPVAS
jgi:YegS/Rv2252/BmrU family lipid kinase